MKRFALTIGLGLSLTACSTSDDSPSAETDTDGSTGASTSPDTMSTSTTTSGPIPTTVTVTATSTTTMGEETGEDSTGNDPTGGETTTGSDTTAGGETTTGTGGDDGYAFDESDPSEYAQVDRVGMPAINSAVITSKDLYNTSTPVDDAAGTFVDEIVANLTGLHGALDDDLVTAGLTPCAVEDCVTQAAPLVVPDTLTITLSQAAGFPNGRLPTDPVMDVTLAVVLLDLSDPEQDATSLVGLNPTANDVAFLADFPYFAPPH